MSRIIVNLFGMEVWNTIFLTCFLTGLLLFLVVLFTSFHDHHTDFSTDYDHFDITGHLDGHHDIFDHSLDHDNHVPTHLELVNLAQNLETSNVQEIKSRFWLGNLSAFLLFFGQIGWFNLEHLGDLSIGLSVGGGYIASSLFSWFISNYTKTVVVPIHDIVRGDVGTVIYDLDYTKSGLIHVKRRDGVISRVLAKGAFPFDNFEPGDRGYIWTGKDGFYTLTRGRFVENQIDKVDKKDNYGKTSFDPSELKSLGA